MEVDNGPDHKLDILLLRIAGHVLYMGESVQIISEFRLLKVGLKLLNKADYCIKSCVACN